MFNTEILKQSKGVTVSFAELPVIDSNYVKNFRKEHNLTQKRLSILLNVTKKTIEKWEQGTNKVSGCAITLFYLFTEKPELMNMILSVEYGDENIKIVNESNLSTNEIPDYKTISNFGKNDSIIKGYSSNPKYIQAV